MFEKLAHDYNDTINFLIEEKVTRTTSCWNFIASTGETVAVLNNVIGIELRTSKLESTYLRMVEFSEERVRMILQHLIDGTRPGSEVTEVTLSD